ncbi:hypothetical protein [Pelagicoccus albus]|uniref:Uncharacterized protein n=1 Tax=Pelagicoccus albus TaxID=415222 RepID=A0A7X1B500_9BACT|nr:hypothetical protein [Pelagicoccus albus]MBC2605774.1 hypothetical protein [Pelagicoccus albus]
MADIYINDEKVEFEGSPPASCGQAYELIEGFLSGQGLMIDKIELDGVQVAAESLLERDNYSELRFRSVSPQSKLLQMCGEWSALCSQLTGKLRGLSGQVLRQGWAKSQSDSVELLEEMRPLIEGLGVLQNFGSESNLDWTSSFDQAFSSGVASIDEVVNAVESKNCVALSDRLADSMAPSWSKVEDCLQSEIIPGLEKVVEQ